jgi:hypothetical protein
MGDRNLGVPSENAVVGEIVRPDLSGKDIAVIRENLQSALGMIGASKTYSEEEVEFMLTKLIADNKVSFSKSTFGTRPVPNSTVLTSDKDNQVKSSSSTILTLEGLGVGVQYVSIGGGDSVSMWW